MPTGIKLILALSLLVNTAGTAIAIRIIHRRGGWTFVRSWLVARGMLRDEAKERFESAYGANKLELFDRLPVGPDDIVFLGDSLTEGGPWHELLADSRCKNRGISGDTSAGVLRRLRQVLDGQPAQIFLMVGVNDLLKGMPVDEVAANIRRIVEAVKEASPRTRLTIQSCLPVNPAILGEGDNEAIRALNEAIAALGTPYLDLYPAFERDGRLDPAYTHDGIHLNGAGYMVWREALPSF
jgi:hypothetical protein